LLDCPKVGQLPPAIGIAFLFSRRHGQISQDFKKSAISPMNLAQKIG
jgi:hypothetical protein